MTKTIAAASPHDLRIASIEFAVRRMNPRAVAVSGAMPTLLDRLATTKEINYTFRAFGNKCSRWRSRLRAIYIVYRING
jgi:hypothetical protein